LQARGRSRHGCTGPDVLFSVCALALVVLALAGCGQSAQQHYASQLNGLCEDFRDAEDEIGEPKSLTDLAENGPAIIQAFDEKIRAKLGDLDPPPELAAKAERMERLADRQHDTLTALVKAAQSRSMTDLATLAVRNQKLNREAGALARSMGADSCGSN
jgi:hypothetical protein